MPSLTLLYSKADKSPHRIIYGHEVVEYTFASSNPDGVDDYRRGHESVQTVAYIETNIARALRIVDEGRPELQQKPERVSSSAYELAPVIG
jgi:hypothetical protein